MRDFIDLVERMSIPLHEIPRVWLGPNGEVMELDEDLGHGDAVHKNMETFSITPDQENGFYNMQEFYPEDGDTEPPFFYDVGICAAEVNGWVRISRDARGDNIAISASTILGIHRGAAWLNGKGIAGFGIEYETETLMDGRVKTLQHGVIPADQVDLFIRTKAIPRKRF